MLFNSDSVEEWEAVLELYSVALKHHIASKNDDSLAELDHWYQVELPATLAHRTPPYLDSSELCKLMSWKLKRGKFRPTLAKQVATNSDHMVKRITEQAFRLARLNDPKEHPKNGQLSTLIKDGIKDMCDLKGVGPATASAIFCAAAPNLVPFMADETMASVPDLGPIKYTLPYYLKFADRVVAKAHELSLKGSKVNTPHLVEKALWTDVMLQQYNVPRHSTSSNATAKKTVASEAVASLEVKEPEQKKEKEPEQKEEKEPEQKGENGDKDTHSRKRKGRASVIEKDEVSAMAKPVKMPTRSSTRKRFSS
ncbi:hypothetical protein BGZ94_002822 [Podila epigama]|nr:hypothetical protein BGZ94_002822 [Podila epigama]